MLINHSKNKVLNQKKSLDEKQDLDLILITYPEILEEVSEGKEIILIDNELGMSFTNENEKNEGGRLDVFFVDENATPILIESKLSKNEEIKRKVVGQLLEYKATSKIYANTDWNANFFKQKILKNDKKFKQSNYEKLNSVLKKNAISEEKFWEEFIYKFQNGFIKLIIASDSIPTRTKRVIEAENEEASYSEFLGLEIKKYTSGSETLLSTQLIGRTEKSKEVKRYAVKEWNFEKFINTLSKDSKELTNLFNKLINIEKVNPTFNLDSEKINPVFNITTTHRDKSVGLLYVVTSAKRFDYPFFDIRLQNFKFIEKKDKNFNIEKLRSDFEPFIDSKQSSKYFLHFPLSNFDTQHKVDKFITLIEKYIVFLTE